MLQRNPFFLFAEMYLGSPEPIEENLVEQEGEEEINISAPIWAFDFGLDKSIEFEQHNNGPVLHWSDEIQQTKSIDQWIDLTHLKADR